MENKYKMIFIFLFLGIIITVIGALFKIMHWPFGRLLLTIGVLTEAIFLIFLIVFILKKSK